MASDVQHPDGAPDPAALLLETARRVAPAWLRSTTLAAADRGGVALDANDPELDRVVHDAAAELVAELVTLLAADVDEQRTNPLSLFRSAVAPMTDLLRRRGVRPPPVDRFAADHFPDDPFLLGPATWSDVDPELHEPGLLWGAWKAMTVLRRRREEGLR